MPFLPRCLRGVVSLMSSQNRISFSGGYSAVKVHEGAYKSIRFVHEASICPPHLLSLESDLFINTVLECESVNVEIT